MNYPIIFLDIDGVLNTHDFDYVAKSNRIHPDKIQTLNYIIRMTGAKIVISSAWRYLVHRGDMTVTGLNWLFRSHGLIHDAIVGVTDEDTPKQYPDPFNNERSYQIEKYLLDNFPDANYIIVDDNDFDFTINGMNFVETDNRDGLIRSKANLIINKLGFKTDE